MKKMDSFGTQGDALSPRFYLVKIEGDSFFKYLYISGPDEGETYHYRFEVGRDINTKHREDGHVDLEYPVLQGLVNKDGKIDFNLYSYATSFDDNGDRTFHPPLESIFTYVSTHGMQPILTKIGDLEFTPFENVERVNPGQEFKSMGDGVPVSFVKSSKYGVIDPKFKDRAVKITSGDFEGHLLYVREYSDPVAYAANYFKVYKTYKKSDSGDILLMSNCIIDGHWGDFFAKTSVFSKGYKTFEEVMQLSELAEQVTSALGWSMFPDYFPFVTIHNSLEEISLEGCTAVDTDIFRHVLVR